MIFNPSQLNLAIARLTALIGSGKRVMVEVVPEKRSNDQNALYWLWLTCIEQETGNDKNDLHDHFRIHYLGVEERKVFGHNVYKPKSTKELDTAQFTQYLEKIRTYCATEQGISLPNPDDKHFEEFKEYYKNFI